MKITTNKILFSLAAIAFIFLAFGCGGEAESSDTVSQRIGTNIVTEFWLMDGTRCVATARGGVDCDWRTGDDFDGVPGR